MLKKFLAGTISFCMLFSFSFAVAPAALASDTLSSGNYTYELNNDDTATVTITGYSAEPTGSLTIPSTLDGKTVTGIGDDAFAFCSDITSVVIPDGVNDIGSEAFSNCTSLATISIPESVQSVYDDMFVGCSSLMAITIDSANEQFCSVDGVVFSADKTTLLFYPAGKKDTSYAIPSGVTDISDYAFYNCEKLTSVSIPSSVQDIEEYAFLECNAMSEFMVDSANTVYASNDDILFNKAKTKLILYPANKPGTSYIIPDNVENLGSCAFNGCQNLMSITISKNVSTIDSGAFEKCEKLTSIEVNSNNTAFVSENGVLFNKGKTTLIAYPTEKPETAYFIPEGIITVESYAFSGCEKLTVLTLPSTLQEIKSNAFTYCTGITSLKIPSGVVSIGQGAFSDCENLVSVLIPASVTNIEDEAFDECSESLTIYGVTSSAANTYATANNIPFKSSGEFPVPVTGVTLDPKAMSLEPAETAAFTATVLPSDATQKAVTWKSSDESVAVVDQTGTVTAVKDGTATITVTTSDGNYAATCVVTVQTAAPSTELKILSGNGTNNTVMRLYSTTTTNGAIRADLMFGTTAIGISVNESGSPTLNSDQRYQEVFPFTGILAGEYQLAVWKVGKFAPDIQTVTVTTSGSVSVGKVTLRLYGDMNGDEKVNSSDIVQIKRYLAGKSSTLCIGTAEEKVSKLLAANVTSASKTDLDSLASTDVMQIQRYASGKTSVFDKMA